MLRGRGDVSLSERVETVVHNDVGHDTSFAEKTTVAAESRPAPENLYSLMRMQ